MLHVTKYKMAITANRVYIVSTERCQELQENQ